MTCEACKTLPAVVPKGYTLKGSYDKLAGLDVCELRTPGWRTRADLWPSDLAGAASSKMGIIDVYDIFGMAPQTLQGADMVAARLDALVVVPDFFKGSPAKHDWVPPDTEEKQKLLGAFVQDRASIPANIEALLAVASEARLKFPSVTSWGAFGLCWGGKVVALASASESPFAASGQAHPGRLEAADAEKLAIPHIVLASKDEPAEVVAEYERIIGASGRGGAVTTYPTMHHGWMGARADLEDEANSKEFSSGYAAFADFFQKHLA